MEWYGSSIGSCIGINIWSGVGSSLGSSIAIDIGISIASRGIVLNSLYSRILGNGLIRCFGSNILCHTYYNFYWVIF